MRLDRVRTPVLAGVLVGTLTMGLLAVGSSPASAGLEQPAVVSKVPVTWTPHIAPDAQWSQPMAMAAEQIGDTLFVGGRFNLAQNAKRTVTYERRNLMAFDATTGAMRDWAPTTDGDVFAMEAADDGDLYVAGRFKNVNGVSRASLVKLDPVTGEIDPTFTPLIKTGRISDMELVNGRLIISGSFAKKIAALNPVTGKNTNYIDAVVAGSVQYSTEATQVFKFSVNPAGDRLMAVGNFTTVDGVNRQRAFMLNLDGTGDTLSTWYYPQLDKRCRTTTGTRVAQLRDVDFSPDGSYFVFVATGYIPNLPSELGLAICDAAARFETDILSPTQPTWINYTGGDTLRVVEVTGAAVYVQGHSRWLDNPLGNDSAGPGAKIRWGGGAIDPVTGLANDWDPVMRKQVGGWDFLATTAGLWILSEGKNFGGKRHHGIAFTPLP